MVTTIHGFSSDRILPASSDYNDRVHYVAISDADRRRTCAMPRRSTTASRSDDFPFDPQGSDDLLFFGRIHPDKGAVEAIAVAHATGRRLVMAGIVQDQGYHDATSRRRSTAIRHLSTARSAEPSGRGCLGSARALLHLISFDEPFGLSVIEAMACGTPVIARNRGSMPELIDHGVTGFLVDSVEEAVAAISRIGEIDRAACRAAVAARFTVDRMADRYLNLYRSLLG